MSEGGKGMGRFDWERALLACPDVTGTRLLVLLVLATYMRADGTEARPTQATLADACGLKERAVRGHLSWAVDAGWLVRVQRGHRVTSDVAVASTYRTPGTQPASPCRLATDPTGTTVPVDATPTGSPVPVGETQPASGRHPTGTPVPPIKEEQEPTTSSSSSTHVPAARPVKATERARAAGSERRDNRRNAIEARWTRHDWSKPLTGHSATRERIFDAMAARELMLAREMDRPGLPPAGSPREWAWLDEVAENLRVEHEARTLELHRSRPDLPIEDFIWHLDMRLSAGGDPVMRAHTARYDELEAERLAAEAARTPEDIARDRAAARRCVTEIKAQLAAHQNQIPV